MKETITEFVELVCLVGVCTGAITATKFLFNYILSLI